MVCNIFSTWDFHMWYFLIFCLLVFNSINLSMTKEMTTVELKQYNDCLWDNKAIISPQRGGLQRILRRVNTFFYQKYAYPEGFEEGYKKDLSLECFLLYSVYNNNLKIVQWLLDKKPLTYISFITSCYGERCQVLSCLEIARYKEHSEMLTLFSEDKNKGTANINIDLCMTSCIGDIAAFEEIIQKNENPKENKKSIPLVIWAATKNFDVRFLKNLHKHQDYKKYMERNSDKFLRFSFLGFSFQTFFTTPRLHTEYIFSRRRIEKIKELILSNCFELLSRNRDCSATWNMRPSDYIKAIVECNKTHPEYENIKEAYDFIDQKTIEAYKLRKPKVKIRKSSNRGFYMGLIGFYMRYLFVFCVLFCSTINLGMTRSEYILRESKDCIWGPKALLPFDNRMVLKQTNRFFYNSIPYPEGFEEGYKKGISLECLLLYSVYENKVDIVKWLLSKKIAYTFVLFDALWVPPQCLYCATVAVYKEHNAMIELLLHDRNKAEFIRLSKLSNIDLCITSCKGDIAAFESILQRKNKTDAQKALNEMSIPLVICAAIKNGDSDFLKNLQKHKKYAKFMQENSSSFLLNIIIGQFRHGSFIKQPKFLRNNVFTDYRVEKIKRLISSDCFKDSPAIYDFVKRIINYNKNHPDYKNMQKVHDFIYQRMEEKGINITESESNWTQLKTRMIIASALCGAFVVLINCLSQLVITFIKSRL